MRKIFLICAPLVLALACDSSEDEGGGGGDTDGTPGVPAPYAGKANPSEGDSAAISAGESTYTSTCATCHGAAGAGDGPAGMGSNPPPTDFTAETQPDDYMLWTISDGVPMTTMAAYKSSLSEAQIWEVVSYIRTLQ